MSTQTNKPFTNMSICCAVFSLKYRIGYFGKQNVIQTGKER